MAADPVTARSFTKRLSRGIIPPSLNRFVYRKEINLTAAQSTLCTLLQSALWGIKAEYSEDIPWREVFRLGVEQSVLALILDAVPHDRIPADLLETALVESTRQIRKFYRILKIQDDLTKLLKDAEIPFVFLKGVTVGALYPHPEKRSYGDIDLLVAKDRAEEACALLNHHGYALMMEAEDRDHLLRHYHLQKEDISVELHRHFCDATTELEERINETLSDALLSPEPCVIAGRTYPMLSDAANAVMLLWHIRLHMISALCFRQVLDFVFLIYRRFDGQRWKRELKPLLESLGLEKLAEVVCKTAQIYWGLPVKDNQLLMNVSQADCEALLSYMLDTGATTTDGKAKDSALAVYNHTRGIKSTLRYLQSSGEINWKTSWKHPKLKRLAVFYQLWRYACKIVTGKQSLPELIRQFGKRDKREELMKKLGLENN